MPGAIQASRLRSSCRRHPETARTWSCGSLPIVSATFGRSNRWSSTDRVPAGSSPPQAAVAAEPDGYTLFDALTSTLLVLPVTQNRSFDLNHALVPIGQAGDQPFVIGVSPSLGVNTLPELIALAKSKPGKILYAAAQRGSMPHLASELLRSRADIDIGFVPYPSTTQAVQDIVGGRISVIFEGMSALAGPIKAGWVKPIAVTSPQRLPNFPDIPAAAESVNGYRASGWFVLMAHAGTPDAIIQKTQSRFAHRSRRTRTSGQARQASLRTCARCRCRKPLSSSYPSRSCGSRLRGN